MLNKKQRIQSLRQIADRLIRDLAEEDMFFGELNYPLIDNIITLHHLANTLKNDKYEEADEGSDS
jgi:hypothetical protein